MNLMHQLLIKILTSSHNQSAGALCQMKTVIWRKAGHKTCRTVVF